MIPAIPINTPFRYLDLPQELRLLILEYTDLVSEDYIQWRPRKVVLDCSCEYEFEMRVMVAKDECICATSNYRPPNADCCGECGPSDESLICYCSKRGPTFSSSCRCRPLRPSLFSVSRQVRADAIHIYYSQNRFIVTPFNSLKLRTTDLETYMDGSPHAIYNIPQIELSLYLSSIARNALQYIRWLEWVLPYAERRYLCPLSLSWHDYMDTVQMMEHAMNLPNLTLIVDIVSPRCEHFYSNGQYHKRIRTEVLNWYSEISTSIRRLGSAGLKDFFVYIGRDSRNSTQRIYHEKRLEKIVMGPQYNSDRRGKPRERNNYHSYS